MCDACASYIHSDEYGIFVFWVRCTQAIRKKSNKVFDILHRAQMQIYVHIGAGGFPERDPSFKQEQADLDQGRPVSPRV